MFHWLIPLLCWSLLYFGLQFWWEWRLQKEKTDEATGLAQDTLLKTQTYQLDPHFLFSTLNSIRSLITEDAAKAKGLIIELSEFFRYSLMSRNCTTATLREELEAVRRLKLVDGVADILTWLKDRGKNIVIITRNGGKCVEEAFNKFNLHSPDLVVSRDDVKKVKPDRAHVDFILAKLKLRPEECIIVGDSTHDVELGRNADIPVVLVDYEHKARDDIKDSAKTVVSSLFELKAIIEGV